jgi:proline iminopeptidase
MYELSGSHGGLSMTKIAIRGISLNVKVFGHGFPLALMHGGPGGDLYTLMSFKPLKDTFTLVFYDHRCNGRSTGADVTSLNMDNLTADADALRISMGFEKWAVLGHSFGGAVALEYALRYPQNLSHLILMDTGADFHSAHENAPKVLAERGFPPETVELAGRFLNGLIEPKEMFSSLMKLGDAYNPYTGLAQMPHMIFYGSQTKLRPEALIYSAQNYLKNWSVIDRLGEIQVPTLVLAGRDDFIFPPEFQEQMAKAIPNASLVLIDRAGHNPQAEQTEQVLNSVRNFLTNEKSKANT